MFNLSEIIRENIINLKPYVSARSEFSSNEAVFLDANENPYGELNRYPDPFQSELKEKLAQIKEVDMDNIFIGNGSDEIIDLVFRLFCEPKNDKALTFSPTYGMYKVSAGINDIELIELPLNKEFEIDIKMVEKNISTIDLKLIIICSPNNPTGNLMNIDTIDFIIKEFKGIVLIDEAYIDFSEKESQLRKINENPNLIVIQTFSKAWGLASARIGAAYANKEIVKLLNRIKPPYNVSDLNQKSALNALKNLRDFNIKRNIIHRNKDILIQKLNQINCVIKVFSSDANFLLVKVNDADYVYKKLKAKHIITRNRHTQIKNCIRITVGTDQENERLIKVLKTL